MFAVKTEKVSDIRIYKEPKAHSVNCTETTGQFFTQLHVVKRDFLLIRH